MYANPNFDFEAEKTEVETTLNDTRGGILFLPIRNEAINDKDKNINFRCDRKRRPRFIGTDILSVPIETKFHPRALLDSFDGRPGTGNRRLLIKYYHVMGRLHRFPATAPVAVQEFKHDQMAMAEALDETRYEMVEQTSHPPDNATASPTTLQSLNLLQYTSGM
ncbi:hypothetical protein Zmor_021690 [Zophobas morio]|uniref:Uncharacterized protein n=1 Tax=Zophobas morio TaxID=2755281 RepID=A0AA38I968_9CUCU|nr:hypothetical protein Zmor_021690 [Zophobas morio]